LFDVGGVVVGGISVVVGVIDMRGCAAGVCTWFCIVELLHV